MNTIGEVCSDNLLWYTNASAPDNAKRTSARKGFFCQDLDLPKLTACNVNFPGIYYILRLKDGDL